MTRLRVLLSICAIIALSLSARAGDPATFAVSELNFTRPAGWTWVEPTPMRKAQLRIPGAKPGETGDVVFFYFGPGSGGGTQANVDRWFGQFAEGRDKINAKSETVKLNGTSVTYVSAQGTYQSGMPGGAKTPLTDHGLLGAIIEAGQGSVFVRLTAPTSLANASTSEFKKMVESSLKK